MGKGKEGNGKGRGRKGEGRQGEGWEEREEEGEKARGEFYPAPLCPSLCPHTAPPSRKKLAPPMTEARCRCVYGQQADEVIWRRVAALLR